MDFFFLVTKMKIRSEWKLRLEEQLWLGSEAFALCWFLKPLDLKQQKRNLGPKEEAEEKQIQPLSKTRCSSDLGAAWLQVMLTVCWPRSVLRSVPRSTVPDQLFLELQFPRSAPRSARFRCSQISCSHVNKSAVPRSAVPRSAPRSATTKTDFQWAICSVSSQRGCQLNESHCNTRPPLTHLPSPAPPPPLLRPLPRQWSSCGTQSQSAWCYLCHVKWGDQQSEDKTRKKKESKRRTRRRSRNLFFFFSFSLSLEELSWFSPIRVVSSRTSVRLRDASGVCQAPAKTITSQLPIIQFAPFIYFLLSFV